MKYHSLFSFSRYLTSVVSGLQHVALGTYGNDVLITKDSHICVSRTWKYRRRIYSTVKNGIKYCLPWNGLVLYYLMVFNWTAWIGCTKRLGLLEIVVALSDILCTNPENDSGKSSLFFIQYSLSADIGSAISRTLPSACWKTSSPTGGIRSSLQFKTVSYSYLRTSQFPHSELQAPFRISRTFTCMSFLFYSYLLTLPISCFKAF